MAACLPRMGAHATAIDLSPSRLVPVPEALPSEVAAALPLDLVTAGLATSLAALPPGGTLLVQGACGPVGSLLVQHARAAGHPVIGTSSARNRTAVESLGADVGRLPRPRRHRPHPRGGSRRRGRCRRPHRLTRGACRRGIRRHGRAPLVRRTPRARTPRHRHRLDGDARAHGRPPARTPRLRAAVRWRRAPDARGSCSPPSSIASPAASSGRPWSRCSRSRTPPPRTRASTAAPRTRSSSSRCDATGGSARSGGRTSSHPTRSSRHSSPVAAVNIGAERTRPSVTIRRPASRRRCPPGAPRGVMRHPNALVVVGAGTCVHRSRGPARPRP